MINQNSVQLRFCPVSGDPIEDKDYYIHNARDDYGVRFAWLFNPWTGAPRDPRDIASDVFGQLIVPPSDCSVNSCGCDSDSDCNEFGRDEMDEEIQNLRDHFAGLTLQGLYASGIIDVAHRQGVDSETNMAAAASWAYAQADAMLAVGSTYRG